MGEKAIAGTEPVADNAIDYEGPIYLARGRKALAALVQKLQTRVDELEGQSHVSSQPVVSDSSMAAPAQSSVSQASPTPSGPRSGSSLLGGTTVNFLFDGYYAFNFNNPIGRVN